MDTRNAAIRESKCAEMGIRIIHELLGQFVDEDLDPIIYFRCERGALLFKFRLDGVSQSKAPSVFAEEKRRSIGVDAEESREALFHSDTSFASTLIETRLQDISCAKTKNSPPSATGSCPC
jgi:hypothetical protein